MNSSESTLFQCKVSVTSLLYPCFPCSLITITRITHKKDQAYYFYTHAYPGRSCNFAPTYTTTHVALFCSERTIPEFLEMHSFTMLNDGILIIIYCTKLHVQYQTSHRVRLPDTTQYNLLYCNTLDITPTSE